MPTVAEWNADPLAHFQRFVRSPEFAATSRRRRPAGAVPDPIAEASAGIYEWMFRKFVGWLQDTGRTMASVDGEALLAFLQMSDAEGNPDLNSRIAYRYLRLLERVYQHIELSPNPAQSAILGALRTSQSLGRDQEMSVLDDDQMASVMSALPERDSNWKRRRDRAMQLTMLFGGLRVAEVIGLMVPEIDRQASLDGSVQINITPEGKHQSSYAHSTIVREPGAAELLEWLHERMRMPVQGPLLFPANYRGDPLDKATVYRQVKSTFTRAGLDMTRSGGRTLRNTFAVQELDETSIKELTEHLGLALPRSTEAYAIAKAKLK